MEQKIVDLRMVWNKKQEWDDKWDEIKVTKFKAINWEDVVELCDKYIADIQKWDLHVRDWGIS